MERGGALSKKRNKKMKTTPSHRYILFVRGCVAAGSKISASCGCRALLLPLFALNLFWADYYHSSERVWL